MSKKQTGRVFIVMGVSSTGKSTIGEALAKKFLAKFIDGDDLHPKANILKMENGYALEDEDRVPWLERIGDVAYSIQRKNETAFIVCSALKKKYRQQISAGNTNINFIYLHGDFELVKARMQVRRGHFMPIQLLNSQFDTLEIPQEDEVNVVRIDIRGSQEQVLERCTLAIQNIISGNCKVN
ncbi:gluconokinase [Psychromonas sp. KJ10-10]|uniref:gluconokinase n=1 Tax=Psychromonas sp. KJ10-10 TaxID=3391823 RepID=UPI0039B48EEB